MTDKQKPAELAYSAEVLMQDYWRLGAVKHHCIFLQGIYDPDTPVKASRTLCVVLPDKVQRQITDLVQTQAVILFAPFLSFSSLPLPPPPLSHTTLALPTIVAVLAAVRS